MERRHGKVAVITGAMPACIQARPLHLAVIAGHFRVCDRASPAADHRRGLFRRRPALRDASRLRARHRRADRLLCAANVPGKRVSIVRVFYGPGGFTRAHRHRGSVIAYITKGEISSQLGGGPLETFNVGQSLFEPPGSTHLVSANASNTEPAELIAVFVADEGAQLTTYIE